MTTGQQHAFMCVLALGSLCGCYSANIAAWTCPAGYIFSNSSAFTWAPSVGACVPCNDVPGYYCPEPVCMRARPYNFYWSIDNSTMIDTSAYPAITRNAAASVYGWVGLFPQLTSGNVKINGVIPQLGNLTPHFAKMDVDFTYPNVVPNVNVSGICCLDYEQWRADWNSTTLYYRNASIEYVRQRQPTWNDSQLLATATSEFQSAAENILGGSLRHAQQLRPNCKWGVYGYPKNDFAQGGYMGPWAPFLRQIDDEVLAWLWNASDALLPSIYVTSPNRSKFDGQTTEQYVGSTVNETMRVAASAAKRPLVIPMMWYLYNQYPRPVNWTYMSPADLDIVLRLPADLGADGLLLWGGVSDTGPFTQADLFSYLHSTFGPAVQAANDYACGRLPLQGYPTRQACILPNGSFIGAPQGVTSMGPCVSPSNNATSSVWNCPVSCAPGFYSITNASVANGTCNVKVGMVSYGLTCAPCQLNNISNGRQTQCTPCAAGETASSNKTVCEPLSPTPSPSASATASVSTSSVPTSSASISVTATGQRTDTTSVTTSPSNSQSISSSGSPSTLASESPRVTSTPLLSPSINVSSSGSTTAPVQLTASSTPATSIPNSMSSSPLVSSSSTATPSISLSTSVSVSGFPSPPRTIGDDLEDGSAAHDGITKELSSSPGTVAGIVVGVASSAVVLGAVIMYVFVWKPRRLARLTDGHSAAMHDANTYVVSNPIRVT